MAHSTISPWLFAARSNLQKTDLTMLILELEQSFSWKLDCGNNRVASDSLSKKCPKFYPHGNKLKFGSSRVGFHPPLPQTQCWGVCMCACLFFCCCGPLSSPLFQHCFQGEGRNETELKFVAELTACNVCNEDVARNSNELFEHAALCTWGHHELSWTRLTCFLMLFCFTFRCF